MNITLMAVDGVLRKTMGGAPIPEGVRLYKSLATTGGIVLLLDDWKAREQTSEWLELNGCVNHDFVDFAEGQSHVYLASRLRRQNYAVDLVVEPDPWTAQELIKNGYNTLLFTHAEYSHPAWRPDTDKGVQPWDEITKQVADQARMKAEDARARNDG